MKTLRSTNLPASAKCLGFVFLVTCIFSLANSSALAQTYNAGFSWSRAADWTVEPNSYAGTANGNPVSDSMGNPVWSYEWVQGGAGLGSSDPWYTQTSQRLLWDTNWYGQGYPVWSRASVAGNGVSQDYNPMVAQSYMLQNLANSPPISSADQSPLVRWIDPLSQSTLLSITGTLRVEWQGATGGYPVNVDLVIAQESSAGIFDILFSDTVSKPHNDTTTEFLDVPVSTTTLANPGDSLVYSLRANGESSGNWITLDDPLTITIVPEPAAVAMLGLGGVVFCALRLRPRISTALGSLTR